MTSTLKAAAARIEITPSEADVNAERVFLRGYNNTTGVQATRIRSKLFARVLLLESGERRVAIISLDSAFANESNFLTASGGLIQSTVPKGSRHQWATALGSQDESVLVCATHTHYAPALGEDAADRITSKIQELRKSLVPVTANLGIGTSPLCRFRRPDLLKPVDLDVKPVDLTVSGLLLRSASHPFSPLACLVSYGVHPTLYAKPEELSAEFVGLAMQKLEEWYPVSLFIQGFSGDLSPVFPTGLTRDDYLAIEEFGDYFKNSVLATLRDPREMPVDTLATAQEVIEQRQLPLNPSYGYPADLTINGLRLGSIVLLTCSAEVFFEYGAKVRERAKARGFTHAFLGGLVNGYSGYLPTHAAFHDGLGGYEMNVTPYTDKIEDCFLRGVDRVLDRLKRGEEGPTPK
jgi:hypothetical protein